ncbi:lysozyme inhibitor LprI family protein [Pseudomonas sp. B2M1-30]|uniref:lysozyme inhibitor LprI family protein n=1 Tax=Pseudomonas TaxID=286 RepID=UPI0021C5FF0D|nr:MULTISPECIES: lysozyme inhibitor LprI family protein [Pseudomonas]MCU0117073.1 lysozyme inhibitor LprI family protein [Pseudomonas sp. B2M1-30]MCU7260467.1 lysozyme inhibitor LprI family protein [Pseudomonas koreensis]
MNRFVFALIGALLLPVSAVYAQDDCTQVSSSLEMLPCSESAKKSADTQLNVSYQQLMARLETQYRADPALGSAYAAKVKESQRAWLKLRDANCPLEAFEIETGQPAYVTTVNLCIARMSRDRSVFLDNIASDSGSGLAFGRGSCPTQDFAQFLPAFSANAESQKRLTAQAVKLLVLKGTSDIGRIVTHVTAEVGRDMAFPLMAVVPDGKVEGIEIEKVDDRHVDVVDKRAGNSNIKIFNFSRKACWTLDGVEDWSIPEKELSVASTRSLSREENFCSQRAQGFAGLGGLEQYRLTGELFEAALENYLCAAASGDPISSETAAGLSLSGMAPQLEYSKVEALFKAAAVNSPGGAESLAGFYCFGNETAGRGPCQRPADVEKELIRAGSMGSAHAIVSLGDYWKSGDLGEKDIPRALACYQLAADKGYESGLSAAKRLQSEVIEPIAPSKCY